MFTWLLWLFAVPTSRNRLSVVHVEFCQN